MFYFVRFDGDLYFQKIFNSPQMREIGYEILFRPRKIINRSFFWSKIHRNNLEEKVDFTILNKLLTYLSTMHLPRHKTISINIHHVSVLDDYNQKLIYKIAQYLELNECTLCLELVENGAIPNYYLLKKSLSTLKKQCTNLKIHLDDFSEGLNNIGIMYYLGGLIDGIKISHSTMSSVKHKNLIDFCIYFSKKFDIGSITFEGIDEAAKIATVKGLDVAQISLQGFLLHKPAPITELNIESS
ncbi:EAL domain-containing protein [Vibrio furnissii]|uniref:EAL domain-containing protein n=1 Tax=Vibrio sp. CJQ_6 TaxID=3367165 RepID=UPI00370BB964